MLDRCYCRYGGRDCSVSENASRNGGTVALMLTGTAFLLMGVTGHGIRSVKFGDNEIVIGVVAEAQKDAPAKAMRCRSNSHRTGQGRPSPFVPRSQRSAAERLHGSSRDELREGALSPDRFIADRGYVYGESTGSIELRRINRIQRQDYRCRKYEQEFVSTRI